MSHKKSWNTHLQQLMIEPYQWCVIGNTSWLLRCTLLLTPVLSRPACLVGWKIRWTYRDLLGSSSCSSLEVTRVSKLVFTANANTKKDKCDVFNNIFLTNQHRQLNPTNSFFCHVMWWTSTERLGRVNKWAFSLLHVCSTAVRTSLWVALNSSNEMSSDALWSVKKKGMGCTDGEKHSVLESHHVHILHIQFKALGMCCCTCRHLSNVTRRDRALEPA